MNVVVSASDERSIEVLASGLPFHHGAQLAIDVTLRSALTSCGSAIPGAARKNGAALARARPDKERKLEATGVTWSFLLWRLVADGALKHWS